MDMSDRRRHSRKPESMLSKNLVAVVVGMMFTLVCVIWLSRHALTTVVIDKPLVMVAAKSKKVGIELVDMNSGGGEVPSPLDAQVRNLKTNFDSGRRNEDTTIRSRFESQNVEVTAAGIFPPMVRVRLQDFPLKFHPEDVPADFPVEGFSSGSFISAPLPVLAPEKAIRNTLGRLESLSDENAVKADCNFSGYESDQVNKDESIDALIDTENLGSGVRRLRFKRKGLKQIVALANVRISDAMLEILSECPLRAPMLMAISYKAKKQAELKKKQDAHYPDDAFQHITWSYNLTKTFGPKFAKLVTDSHETLDGNTSDERLMDFHNNAIARGLVAEGVKSDTLEKLILNDPRVIRNSNEVAGFKGLMK